MSLKTKSLILFIFLFLISFSLLCYFGFLYFDKISPQLKALEQKNSDLEKNLNLLSGTIISYLKAEDQKCKNISSKDYLSLSNCLKETISKELSKPKLIKIGFKQASKDNPGYIVLLNVGKTPLDSKDFSLYRNNILEDSDGCKIKGKIKTQYPCLLNFYEESKEGDVLEVFWKDQSVFIENFISKEK